MITTFQASTDGQLFCAASAFSSCCGPVQEVNIQVVCYVHRLEEGSDPSFLCERVCTSNRLLRRMGGLSKVWIWGLFLHLCRQQCLLQVRLGLPEQTSSLVSALVLISAPVLQDPTPNTCVTVCGTSGQSSC